MLNYPRLKRQSEKSVFKFFHPILMLLLNNLNIQKLEIPLRRHKISIRGNKKFYLCWVYVMRDKLINGLINFYC